MGMTGQWLRMLRLSLLAGCLLVLWVLLTAEESVATGDGGLPSAVAAAPPVTTPARPASGAPLAARAAVNTAARTGAAGGDARPSAERAVPAAAEPEASSTRRALTGHSPARVPSRPDRGVRETAEPVTAPAQQGSAKLAGGSARAAEAALTAAESTADEVGIDPLVVPVTGTARQISASTVETAEGATAQLLDAADALSSTLAGLVPADLATVLQGEPLGTAALWDPMTSPAAPAMPEVGPSAPLPFPGRPLLSGTEGGLSAWAVTAVPSPGAGAPLPGPVAPRSPASSESPGWTGSGSGGLATADLGEALALPELISLLPGWAHDRFVASPGPRPSFRPE